MQKKSYMSDSDKPHWMTECDVIRYNLKIPEEMKNIIKDEARRKGLDMSSYICGVLAGDIKRPKQSV